MTTCSDLLFAGRKTDWDIYYARLLRASNLHGKDPILIFTWCGPKGHANRFHLTNSGCESKHRCRIYLSFSWNNEHHAWLTHTSMLLWNRSRPTNRACVGTLVITSQLLWSLGFQAWNRNIPMDCLPHNICELHFITLLLNKPLCAPSFYIYLEGLNEENDFLYQWEGISWFAFLSLILYIDNCIWMLHNTFAKHQCLCFFSCLWLLRSIWHVTCFVDYCSICSNKITMVMIMCMQDALEIVTQPSLIHMMV